MNLARGSVEKGVCEGDGGAMKGKEVPWLMSHPQIHKKASFLSDDIKL